jgi:phage replication O-like protein O
MVKTDPDPKDGHIDIAHEIAEALMRINLSGYQYRIIWCIIRKTWGWHKSTDKISLTLFEKMTGLKSKYICKAIKDLEDRNMIIVDRNNRVNTYKFNSHYDTWKLNKQSLNKESQKKRKKLYKRKTFLLFLIIGIGKI